MFFRYCMYIYIVYITHRYYWHTCTKCKTMQRIIRFCSWAEWLISSWRHPRDLQFRRRRIQVAEIWVIYSLRLDFNQVLYWYRVYAWDICFTSITVNDHHSILSSICASKSRGYVTLHQHLYSSTKTCLWAAWFAMSRDQLFVIPRCIQFPTLCTVYYVSSRLDSRPYAERTPSFSVHS